MSEPQSMTINEIQDQVIEDFSLFEDWADKYEYLIDLGKHLPELEAQFRTEDNKVHGCQAQVWLHAREADGMLFFDADSDAFITKGIIGLLVKVLSGHPPREIVEADLYFIQVTGLQSHLSPTRANGLAAMVKQLKAYAVAYDLRGRDV